MTAERPPACVYRSRILIRCDPSPWVAFCRSCLWQRSYPTWRVAVHAAVQHVTHWRAKEDQRNEVPF